MTTIAERLCMIEGCGKKHVAKGLCSMHYQRNRLGEALNAPVRGVNIGLTCAFYSCLKPAKTKSLCGGHYQQLQAGTELRPLGIGPRRAENYTGRCSVGWCDRKVRSNGLCGSHLSRQHKGLSLDTPFVPQGKYRDHPCSITGCDLPWLSRGLCKRHQHKTNYGLTAIQLDMLVRIGTCGICKKALDLYEIHIDHDHLCCPKGGSCGNCVRGTLCANGNTALGMLGDSTQNLYAAIAYLAISGQ